MQMKSIKVYMDWELKEMKKRKEKRKLVSLKTFFRKRIQYTLYIII